MRNQALTGQVAVVTGGGSGIGAATARLLAAHGAKVVIAGRRNTALQEIVTSHENIAAYVADISLTEDVNLLFDFTQKHFGFATILVNCAAVIDVIDFEAMPLELWHHTLNVNVTGSMLCCHALFKHCRKSGKTGAIVNISSLGGIRSTQKFKGLLPYVTSKFAVVGLTEALAVEGKTLGIRVNCVAPGAVATDMLAKAAPFLKTSTTPEDVAKTVFFLCDTAQSGKITGSTIEIHSNE